MIAIERKSSIELLRICCIMGIIMMHIMGGVDSRSAAIENKLWIILCNAIFNAGVTCFVLISGYFGISFKIKKLIYLDIIAIFYTLLFTFFSSVFTVKGVIYAFFPVITKRYWFLTCYIILCFLSPYLNEMVEYLKEKELRRLILILVMFFSIIPTFFRVQIIEDNGKGIVQLVMVYLIGRYLKYYYKTIISTKILTLMAIAMIAIVFSLNVVISLIFKDGGIASTFCSDNSIFIIGLSVLLFLIFLNMNFHNQVINQVSKNVIAVYILESQIRDLLGNRFLDINMFMNSHVFIIIVALQTIIVFTIAIGINMLRTKLLNNVDMRLTDYIYKIIMKIPIKINFK